MRAQEAVPALVRNLRVSNDLDRSAAVVALGQIGDPSASRALVEVAHDDPAAAIRVNAINSLAMLNDPDGILMLAQLGIEPNRLLESAVRNIDLPFGRTFGRRTRRRTRKWALSRLVELRSTDAIPELRAAKPTGLIHSIRLRRTIRMLEQC
jgi:HEAT repeat protein